MRRAVLLVLVVAVGAACGCAREATGAKELRSVSTSPPRPVDRVDQVHVLVSPPTVLNWDDTPGPDGVQVNVYLSVMSRAEPVLGKGTLDFLLFEGRVPKGSVATSQPYFTWTFGLQELATRQVRGVAGWGYAVQLGWGQRTPKAGVITLVARYVAKDGPPVYSSPVSIPMSGAGDGGPAKAITIPPKTPATQTK